MRIRHPGFSLALAGVLALSVTACSLDNLLEGNDPLGETQVEVTSYAGAVGVYRSTIYSLALALSNVSKDVGVMTDELVLENATGADLDARTESRPGYGIQSGAYSPLHTTRVRASQAVSFLQKYGTEVDYPKIGHAYAMEAYAIMLLAEVFCSGVPLTTVPVSGHMQYTSGFSTTELLERAVELFDSAYFYGKDSLPIATLARVGKGRALLGLAQYDEAAAAVASVPGGAKYIMQFTTQTNGRAFWTPTATQSTIYKVVSGEGVNGVTWTADSAKLQDPRVPLSTLNDLNYTNPIRQRKYVGGALDFVLADAVEAQMIKAESELQPPSNPSGPWLTTINAARATRSLPPLDDPGTAQGRVDLLFRERAFWFYLNGTRLGDIRRLVRNYDRLPAQVYPSGVYSGPLLSVTTYGQEYVFSPPSTEQDLNPLYDGCIDKQP